MNVDQTFHQSSLGMIDETVEFLVTTMRISANDIKELPSWLRNEVPQVPAYRNNLDRLFDRIAKGRPTGQAPLPHFVLDEEVELHDIQPTWFIGSSGNPLSRTSAPKLPHQLAELGIIPLTRKVYFRGFQYDVAQFGINLYWNWRKPKHDSEQTEVAILQNQQFFMEWHLIFGWTATGRVYQKPGRVLVLDFRKKRYTPPSLRHHEISICDSHLAVI